MPFNGESCWALYFAAARGDISGGALAEKLALHARLCKCRCPLCDRLRMAWRRRRREGGEGLSMPGCSAPRSDESSCFELMEPGSRFPTTRTACVPNFVAPRTEAAQPPGLTAATGQLLATKGGSTNGQGG
jgi:hypothetical protein